MPEAEASHATSSSFISFRTGLPVTPTDGPNDGLGAAPLGTSALGG